MKKIHKLDKNLINLIAAGEVIERPASVLKELLENSIDAGADKIQVDFKNGGLDVISIKDNGSGIMLEDADLIFEQHATSKISTPNDLDNIFTLGFRGEALASIGSASSKVEVLSKSGASRPFKSVFSDREQHTQELEQLDQGTQIIVTDLFGNIPARRKFLKSTNTESRNIIKTFLENTLPHLQTSFELSNEGKEIYKLHKTEDFKNRVFDIWGANIAKNIYDKEEFSIEGLKIEFYLGKPDIAKKSNPLQYIFVNNRFIINKTISAAVAEGFKGFIHTDLKPSFFIFITIDPSKVDVNIHPRKLEVRFENSDEIFRIVYGSTKKILEKNTRESVRSAIPFESRKGENYAPFINSTKTESYSNKTYSGSQNGFRSIPRVSDVISFSQNISLIQDTNTDSDRENTSDRAPELAFRPYQIFNTYIVIERKEDPDVTPGSDTLIFIDQHAAAEKIMFEKLVSQLNNVLSKPLLVPIVVELNQFNKSSILDKADELKSIGFHVEDFGSNLIQITEIPEILGKFDANEFIEMNLNYDSDLKKNYENYETYNGITLTKDLYLIIATTACHGSIRAGQPLSESEMRQIVTDLYSLQNPYNCPHGRPTMWELKRTEIEKFFRRDL